MLPRLAALCCLLLPTAAWAKATTAHAGSDATTVLRGGLGELALTAGLTVALALAALLRARARRGDTPVLSAQLKLTHLLPTLIQLLIYAYWGLYWRALPAFLPLIALQLVFAFALDALLALVRHGRWTLRLGPAPIVLSANLIVLFGVASWPLSLAVVAVALLSRDLLRIRGRHVFNPSAFGVAVVGVANLLVPALGYSDRAHEFDLPPHMTEVVVLLALVVQVRLPVVLVTLGAAGALWLLQTAGLHVFSPTWAPVTLILLLFLTDPATTPRTQGGRLLFGLLAGTLMGLIGHGLEALGYSDFYAKVLALPFTNVATPWLDRAARRLARALPAFDRAVGRRWNRAHVAAWLLFVGATLSPQDRADRLQRGGTADHHRENRSAFLTPAGGPFRCEANPLYCRPWRLDLELRCWAGQLGLGRPCAGPPIGGAPTPGRHPPPASHAPTLSPTEPHA